MRKLKNDIERPSKLNYTRHLMEFLTQLMVGDFKNELSYFRKKFWC